MVAPGVAKVKIDALRRGPRGRCETIVYADGAADSLRMRIVWSPSWTGIVDEEGRAMARLAVFAFGNLQGEHADDHAAAQRLWEAVPTVIATLQAAPGFLSMSSQSQP